MEESILTSIKKRLGITEDYTVFDQDIIMDINTVIMILNQMGVGATNFHIVDKTATWEDFIGTENTILEMVKSYIYLKVRLIFDPPTTGGGVLDATNDMIAELEWRLNSEVDYHTKHKD